MSTDTPLFGEGYPAETLWHADYLDPEYGMWFPLCSHCEITDAAVTARTHADETGQRTRITRHQLGSPVIEFTPQPQEG